MDLIIVESPTKARTLSRFLGDGYRVEATMGHIRDLPEKELGIDLEKDFEPQYVWVKNKKETIDRIKNAAIGAKNIYLASDPDREGEAIAYHVEKLISSNSKLKNPASTAKRGEQNITRITFHEITKTAIDAALNHPGVIDSNLVEAQETRRILDRLVGYKLSPLLWNKIRKGLSAGRVQSVAVRLIVERERDIQKFIPVEFWEIEAILDKLPQNGQGTILAKLVRKGQDKIVISNKEEADLVLNDLNSSIYKIISIEKKEFKKYSPAPFTTSTLQQTAANRFGWTSKRTMNVAQSLYENGYITYHRTDSTNLSVDAVNIAREYIKLNYGPDYLPETLKVFATKSKVAQEAHEAIRPTEINSLDLGVNIDEKKLYGLIWKRFIACQVNPSITDMTTVTTEAKSNSLYYLETKGGIEKFDGWRKVYGKVEEEEENKDDQTGNLPELKENEDLKLNEIKPQQKFTQPPPRFNEASLIKALEELGIGRPSTYAPTISNIQDKNYIEKQEKQFIPTQLGITVNDFLMKYFSDVLDYGFTAQMEDDLDEIANGKKKRVPLLKEFYKPFAAKLAEVFKQAQSVRVKGEDTGEKCPLCKKGNVQIKIGKFGKFLACDQYPDCNYRAPFVQKVEGVTCPKCQGDVIFKKTKSGKGFFGCSNYPKCDFASWHKPIQPHTEAVIPGQNK